MSLPRSGKHVENNLDKLLRAYRKEELQMIIESATVLRENATDINEALGEVDGILQQLKNLAQEVGKIFFMKRIILKSANPTIKIIKTIHW
jgi:hypothetical protein